MLDPSVSLRIWVKIHLPVRSVARTTVSVAKEPRMSVSSNSTEFTTVTFKRHFQETLSIACVHEDLLDCSVSFSWTFVQVAPMPA